MCALRQNDPKVTAFQVSVVISGPIFHDAGEGGRSATALGCESVRRLLPGAEIVLSTWVGEDVSGIDYDRVVFSEDPGPNSGNVNRQICSRRAGIQAASREYVLAMRSESYLVNDNFLHYLDQYPLHGTDCVFLKNRIILAAAFPPESELFHIGDWYFAGHKEDLLAFWDLPYKDDSQYNHPGQIYNNPHRYLITSFVRKYRPLQFDVLSDIHRENRELYRRIMIENFVVTGFAAFGARSYKYPFDESLKGRLFQYHVSYTFEEWKQEYNKLCHGREPVRFGIEEFFGVYLYRPAKVMLEAVKNRIRPALKRLRS